MRILNLFLCCLPLLFICCSDSIGPGDDGDGEIVASENIGSGGGTITSNEIVLTVPAGAFDSETSITLTTSPENPFEEDAVSGSYIIGSLPLSFSEEITVSVAYEGELSENSYIALGVKAWVSSFGEMATTYTMLPATVDGDMLTAVLPANPGGVAKAAMTDAEESSSVTVTAVTGYEPYVTAGGHFKIAYASRWTTPASVAQLGQYLEEAYTTIEGLGFSYASRTNWPVSVTVKNLDDEVYGYSSNSLWGNNYGYLEFNAKKMADLAELRTTAGHEFFHLTQSLYDPRNFYSKAKLSSPHLWLDEACAVWIEEKFTDQQNYVSTARAGNVLAPFNGVVAGAEDDAGKHGYGLSAMIKYLVGEHGESCLPKIYAALRNGSDAMTAVVLSTEEPLEWWEEFLRQYTLGEIYGVELSPLTANKDGMFRIITDSDTLATFSDPYPDLSGNIYVVRLENQNIGEDAVLSLSVEGGMGEVSAIKYRLNPFAVEFLGTDTEEVTVSGLQSLVDGDWHILALVSNSRSISPYTKDTDIDLTVRVTKPINPGFNFFTLHHEFIGDFEHVSYINSDFNKTYTSLFDPSLSPAGYGTLTGTTFTAIRNQPYQDTTIIGETTIEFDETFENILSIDSVQTITHPATENSAASFHNMSFSAQNLPISQNDNGSYGFRLTGNEITEHVTTGMITSMTFEYGIVGDRKTTLVGIHGGGGSDFSINLRKE